MANAKVPKAEFVEAWNSSSTIREVMDKTGLCRKSVHNKKRRLREFLDLMIFLPEYNNNNDNLILSGFGYWLCGLIDGEGHLAARLTNRNSLTNGKNYKSVEVDTALQITLRNDDRPTLEYIMSTMECGRIHTRRIKSIWNPVCDYKISKTEDIIYRVIPIIKHCELRTKKSREFDLWSEIVHIKYNCMVNRTNGKIDRNGTRLTDEQINRIEILIEKMKDIRHVST